MGNTAKVEGEISAVLIHKHPPFELSTILHVSVKKVKWFSDLFRKVFPAFVN